MQNFSYEKKLYAQIVFVQIKHFYHHMEGFAPVFVLKTRQKKLGNAFEPSDPSDRSRGEGGRNEVWYRVAMLSQLATQSRAQSPSSRSAVWDGLWETGIDQINFRSISGRTLVFRFLLRILVVPSGSKFPRTEVNRESWTTVLLVFIDSTKVTITSCS